MKIGRSVRPQIDAECARHLSAPSQISAIAAERLNQSSWTQKTFDRAVKELSNGVKFDNIRFQRK